MNENERKQWLAELKIGDKVAVNHASFGRHPNWSILTVKYFTRTRNRFDLVSPDRPDHVQSVGKDGYFPRGSAWRQTGIYPVTAEVLGDMEWVRTSYKLSNLETKMTQRQRELTLEQMKRLIAVYEEILGDEVQKQDQGQ